MSNIEKKFVNKTSLLNTILALTIILIAAVTLWAPSETQNGLIKTCIGLGILVALVVSLWSIAVDRRTKANVNKVDLKTRLQSSMVETQLTNTEIKEEFTTEIPDDVCLSRVESITTEEPVAEEEVVVSNNNAVDLLKEEPETK